MRIINKLLEPLAEYSNFLICLFLMTSFIDVIYLIFIDRLYLYSIYFALHGYIMCYLIVLFGSFLKSNIFKWYKIIFYFLGIINVLIDFICHYIFNMGFAYDMVGIIRATNIQEVQEFMNMYLSWNLLLACALVVVFCFLLIKYIKPIRWTRLCQLGALGFFSLGLILIIAKESTVWQRIFLGKPFLLCSYTLPPDLKQYRTDVSIVRSRDLYPQNVIIIIGESFSKSHSQLYGYDKMTNPKLYAKQQDSLLYVFSNISAPATNTIECFKQIMSTYEYSSSKSWYEHITLIDILNKSSYKTIWVSNQSQKGGYDNVVAKYAELCDTMCWVGNRFQGVSRTSYDEEVLPILKSIKNTHSASKAFFVHLMGSHYTFNSRYPEKYNYFTEKDYGNLLSNQRRNIAEYDNSVLYNDYVVNEIIDVFKDEETIVIYFPDHGLDLYDSSDDYIGHGTSNEKSSIVSKQIPFVVFVSDKLRDKDELIVSRIVNSIDKQFNTTNLIYTIMDIIGVDFNDKIIEKESLFRQ